MCFGHTHKPFHRILDAGEEGQNHYRHAINIGSVGKPKDGDNRGGYVMLTINDNSSVLDRDSVQVKFIRFKYDYERAPRAVEESILPNEYAENLRKGC